MSDPLHIDPRSVAAAIQQRKTLKVLGNDKNRAVLSPEAAEKNRQLVLDSLRIAGWAPFHYDRAADELAEPWRAHVLWHQDCQKLAPELRQLFPDLKPTSKIVHMMYGCGALVLVTWLPQFYGTDERKPAQVAVDEEHLAASSAMVQNFLLMLTAYGMGTYWSSGGKLGDAAFFDRVGVPTHERLLAAVFVEYPETLGDDRQRIPGKHRDSRSDGWIHEITEV